VLQFTARAHDGPFTIGVGLGGTDPQQGDAADGQEAAEFFADGDQGLQVFREAVGEGILDDGQRRRFPGRGGDGLPHFPMGFLQNGHNLSDFQRDVLRLYVVRSLPTLSFRLLSSVIRPLVSDLRHH